MRIGPQQTGVGSSSLMSPVFSFWLRPGRLRVRPRPVKFGGGSVMIWWCSSKAGLGQICLSEGRMNHVRQFWGLVFFFPQQDNAPCYIAKSIKARMVEHLIKTLSWPAQCPDLNPIENLWNGIKRKMHGLKPSKQSWTYQMFAPGLA